MPSEVAITTPITASKIIRVFFFNFSTSFFNFKKLYHKELTCLNFVKGINFFSYDWKREEIYLDIDAIKKIIPHRYPFLLVDKILEIEEGRRAVGIKNVTANEYFFVGHFPDYPVMPGVLIVEALAQVGAVAILSKEENKGKIAFFAGIDGVRFKKQVRPGDQLRLETEIIKAKGPIGVGQAKATVDGEIVAQGELMFAIK
ncbi:MAG TPA: 3-hydroxyacyl-ACP dehydratase FabZ [Actinobacteria bacterium]|nr:3-hydroxyacyl-ACP dehydratase FabZ [Actinomycetota bacterium]